MLQAHRLLEVDLIVKYPQVFDFFLNRRVDIKQRSVERHHGSWVQDKSCLVKNIKQGGMSDSTNMITWLSQGKTEPCSKPEHRPSRDPPGWPVGSPRKMERNKLDSNYRWRCFDTNVLRNNTCHFVQKYNQILKKKGENKLLGAGNSRYWWC